MREAFKTVVKRPLVKAYGNYNKIDTAVFKAPFIISIMRFLGKLSVLRRILPGTFSLEGVNFFMVFMNNSFTYKGIGEYAA